MKPLLSASALFALSQYTAASAIQSRADPIHPKVKGTPSVLGNLADATLNRDSCGSSNFGDRAFWVCRDSQHYDSNGIPIPSLISSTASWSDLTAADGSEEQMLMYGDNNDQSFYPLLDGQCNDNESGL
jgi:hypothetical protein